MYHAERYPKSRRSSQIIDKKYFKTHRCVRFGKEPGRTWSLSFALAELQWGSSISAVLSSILKIETNTKQMNGVIIILFRSLKPRNSAFKNPVSVICSDLNILSVMLLYSKFPLPTSRHRRSRFPLNQYKVIILPA